jgi:hypothetical protein
MIVAKMKTFVLILIIVALSFVNSLGQSACSSFSYSNTVGQAQPLSQHGWICVFEDNFTGHALDIDKWQIPNAPTQPPGSIGINTPGNLIYTGNDVIIRASKVSQSWGYQTSYLHTVNTFPSTWPWSTIYPGNNYGDLGGGYGIYVLTGTLPVRTNSVYGICNNTYLPWEPPYGCYGVVSGGTTNPAFWEFGGGRGYSEIDGFEFGNSPWEDSQTTHDGSQANQCSIPTDAGTTDFANGQPHAFYLITTPDEIDWYVDNTLTRSDTRYYVSSSPAFAPKIPYYSTTTVPTNPYWFTPNIFPQPPWALYLDNAVQGYYTPDPFNFPVDFHIQSVKYYEYFGGACNNGAFNGVFSQVNVDQSMLIESRYPTRPAHDPPDINNFDVFVGGTINLNGPIVLHTYKYLYSAPWFSQLKLIAESSVVISGSNSISGYFEAKTKAGICNGDYGGPLPINAVYNNMEMRHHKSDSTLNKNSVKQTDSLIATVKPAITHGQFSVKLTNVSGIEQNQNADIIIYNTLGQAIYHSTVLVEEGNNISINLTNQARGIYIVLIRTNYTLLHKNVVLQ